MYDGYKKHGRKLIELRSPTNEKGLEKKKSYSKFAQFFVKNENHRDELIDWKQLRR